MKIGIFGGTFNPPHFGHINICKHFNDLLHFDKLLIIPTFIPPHKLSDELAPSDDRLEMCRLAFSQIPNAFVSTIETERKGKSYTIDTLTKISSMHPDGKLYFLMGSDMLGCFKQWYRWEDILNMCTICAAERDYDENCRNMFPELDGKIIFSHVKPFVVSSSEIREKISKSENISGLLPEKVIEYIDKRKLYHE